MRKFGKSNCSHTCRAAAPKEDKNCGHASVLGAGVDAHTTTGLELGTTEFVYL